MHRSSRSHLEGLQMEGDRPLRASVRNQINCSEHWASTSPRRRPRVPRLLFVNPLPLGLVQLCNSPGG